MGRRVAGEVNGRTARILLFIIALMVSAFFALPMVWVVLSSIRPRNEIFKYLSPLQSRFYLPGRLTVENFTAILSDGFLRSLFNSVIVSVGTVVLGIVVSVMAAFALVTLRFRGRTALFAAIVISFLVPFEAIAIPLADNVRQWGMSDSYWALILPAVGNGQAVFLLRQFFLAVPEELAEAARVDGANWWTVLWRVYVPISRPALIATGLVLFHFQWQAYLWPLLVTTSPEMNVAPVALATYLGQFDFDYGLLFAGTFVATILPAAVLLRYQRYFTASVTTTGIKG